MLKFLLDENIPGRIWRATQRHNEEHYDKLDVVRVGQVPDLPLSTKDDIILLWAELNNRILVTGDRSTMPGHLDNHLSEGHHCPGILMLRSGIPAREAVEFLTLVAYASQPAEWQDRIEYVT